MHYIQADSYWTVNKMYSNDTNPTFLQVERRSPQYQYRPRNTVDGAKMRASVRMTRYLESWGAAKPFANLHHRDSMTNENGKINTAVCNVCYLSYLIDGGVQLWRYTSLFFCSVSRMCQWASITSRGDQKGKLLTLQLQHSFLWQDYAHPIKLQRQDVLID